MHDALKLGRQHFAVHCVDQDTEHATCSHRGTPVAVNAQYRISLKQRKSVYTMTVTVWLAVKFFGDRALPTGVLKCYKVQGALYSSTVK